MEHFDWAGRDDSNRPQHGHATATLEEIRALTQKRYERGWSVLKVTRGTETVAYIEKKAADLPREWWCAA